MESILEDLVRHVGDNMPELKVVDEDYGQLEFIDQESRDTYPLTFPAVLIDAPDVSWSNIRGLSQKGLATVRARLVIDCYDDTHYTSAAPAPAGAQGGARLGPHPHVQPLLHLQPRHQGLRGHLHPRSHGAHRAGRSRPGQSQTCHQILKKVGLCSDFFVFNTSIIVFE